MKEISSKTFQLKINKEIKTIKIYSYCLVITENKENKEEKEEKEEIIDLTKVEISEIYKKEEEFEFTIKSRDSNLVLSCGLEKLQEIRNSILISISGKSSENNKKSCLVDKLWLKILQQQKEISFLESLLDGLDFDEKNEDDNESVVITSGSDFVEEEGENENYKLDGDNIISRENTKDNEFTCKLGDENEFMITATSIHSSTNSPLSSSCSSLPKSLNSPLNFHDNTLVQLSFSCKFTQKFIDSFLSFSSKLVPFTHNPNSNILPTSVQIHSKTNLFTTEHQDSSSLHSEFISLFEFTLSSFDFLRFNVLIKDKCVAFVECNARSHLVYGSSVKSQLVCMNLFDCFCGDIVGELFVFVSTRETRSRRVSVASEIDGSRLSVDREAEDSRLNLLAKMDWDLYSLTFERSYKVPTVDHDSLLVKDLLHESTIPLTFAITYLKHLIKTTPNNSYAKSLRYLVIRLRSRDYLRKSIEKKDKLLSFVSLNCCFHEFIVRSSDRYKNLCVTTFGACTSVHLNNKGNFGEVFAEKSEVECMLVDCERVFKSAREILSDTESSEELLGPLDLVIGFSLKVYEKSKNSVNCNITELVTSLTKLVKQSKFQDLLLRLDKLEQVVSEVLGNGLIKVNEEVDKLNSDDLFKAEACMSQLLGGVLTGIYGLLSSWYEQIKEQNSSKVIDLFSSVWKYLFEFGFVCSFECLLSAFGDEKLMLQEFYNTARRLVGVRLKLHELTTNANDSFRITSDKLLIVSIGIPSVFFNSIPECYKDKSIPIHPLFFTQGLTEQQLLANLRGEMLQYNVNIKSICLLEKLYKAYKNFLNENEISDYRLNTLDHLLNDIRRYRNKKDLNILLLTEVFIRVFASGEISNKTTPYAIPPFASRFTCCKSAKDRTSMSVTLEQAIGLRYNASDHIDRKTTISSENSVMSTNSCSSSFGFIHPSLFDNLLSTLRGDEGVRMRNVERNISESRDENDGKRFGKFAFNSFQWAILPDLYRPPYSSINGSILQ